MDGREGMALSGSGLYYFNRGIGGSVSGSGSGHVVGSGAPTGVSNPPGFKPPITPHHSVQSNVGIGAGVAAVNSQFQVENPPPSFAHGISMPVPGRAAHGDPAKKKRGRPRKYAPDGTNMSLVLSPTSTNPLLGSVTPEQKPTIRGRPKGSGWKQRLAPLGDWMNNSAGLAFTPHVLHVGVGEDIAEKVLSFAQQRPRALCILSACGSVSTVTLRPPASSDGTVTYEGRFEILCMSGNYLVAESGGPRNRTGGLSISVCSPDGQVIGGAIGGQLVAAGPVQVVVFSFVFGGTKAKDKIEASIKGDKNSAGQSAENSSVPLISAGPSHDPTPSSNTGIWPPGSRLDQRKPEMEIDLARG